MMTLAFNQNLRHDLLAANEYTSVWAIGSRSGRRCLGGSRDFIAGVSHDFGEQVVVALGQLRGSLRPGRGREMNIFSLAISFFN